MRGQLVVVAKQLLEWWNDCESNFSWSEHQWRCPCYPLTTCWGRPGRQHNHLALLKMRKFIGFFERRRATDGRTDRQTLKYSCEWVAEWRQVLGCRQVDRSCLPAAVSILTTPKHSRYMDPESCTRTNINKSVFSYLRRLKRGTTCGVCCWAPCSGRAAIDRYLLPTGPTAANPPHAAAAGEWNRQTD